MRCESSGPSRQSTRRFILAGFCLQSIFTKSSQNLYEIGLCKCKEDFIETKGTAGRDLDENEDEARPAPGLSAVGHERLRRADGIRAIGR